MLQLILVTSMWTISSSAFWNTETAQISTSPSGGLPNPQRWTGPLPSSPLPSSAWEGSGGRERGPSSTHRARTPRAPRAHPARKPHRTACRPPQAPLVGPSRSQEIRFPPVFVSLLRCLLQLCHFLKHPGGSMLRPTGSHGSSSPEPCTFSP